MFHDSVIRGPYKKDAREYWLRRVLETQTQLREIGPDEFREIELITLNELQEIRRLSRRRRNCERRSTRRTNAHWQLCRSRCLVRKRFRAGVLRFHLLLRSE